MISHGYPLLRIAQRVREAYVDRHQHVAMPVTPCVTNAIAGTLELLSRDERRIVMATERSYGAAYRQLVRHYSRLLDDLLQQVTQERNILNNSPPPATPSLRLLYEEFEAAEAEFGSVEFNHGEDRISVCTEPITLEGWYLGAFRIDLFCSELRRPDWSNVLGVEAQEPCPAATSDDVTHPHVQDNRLCAGDAGPLIRQALLQGRICEFFLIVRSVLNTYNQHSAYVLLDEWEGVSCVECGRTSARDDLVYCESCQENSCYDCSDCCPTCMLYFCKNCLIQSHASQLWVCPGCAVSCDHCEEQFLEDEIDDGICSSCAVVEAEAQSDLPDTLTENTHDQDHVPQENDKDLTSAPDPEDENPNMAKTGNGASPATDLQRQGVAETPVPVSSG